jgi:hypothetical protein
MHLTASRRWYENNRNLPEVKAKAAARQAARWKNDPERCRKHLRDGARERHRRNRMTALAAYGGRCTCCGETRWQFLTLQHSNGDGAAHRRELVGKHHRVGGAKFYRKLVAAGCPQDRGIVVLCANCHVAEDLHGGCPHRLERAAGLDSNLSLAQSG